MVAQRFQGSPAGRLVRAGSGDASYWAFVPNPLPPSLILDSALIGLLSDADRAVGELSGLGRATPNPHLLIGPFMRREAVLSSRIEGTQAGVSELYAFEAGQLSGQAAQRSASGPDVLEVSNYVRALEYGLDRISTLPITLDLIRELHARLLEGVRGGRATPGEFRRVQNWIGRPGSSLRDADYCPPPASEMDGALSALERYLYLANDYPPLVRLAFIHYQFEAIHPFLDGNGRIGRLLLALLLVNWNLLSQPLLYLSAYFELHRSAYYDLLLGVSERGAWAEWVAFFLRGVADQARDAVFRAKRLQDLQLEWRERLTQARASALMLRLADSLFESPVLTIPQAQQLLGVTYHSAQHSIGKLIEAGILQQVGDASYGKSYRAHEILLTVGSGEY